MPRNHPPHGVPRHARLVPSRAPGSRHGRARRRRRRWRRRRWRRLLRGRARPLEPSEPSEPSRNPLRLLRRRRLCRHLSPSTSTSRRGVQFEIKTQHVHELHRLRVRSTREGAAPWPGFLPSAARVVRRRRRAKRAGAAPSPRAAASRRPTRAARHPRARARARSRRRPRSVDGGFRGGWRATPGRGETALGGFVGRSITCKKSRRGGTCPARGIGSGRPRGG